MCSSVFDRLSLNGSVHGGAGDVEQLGEFGGGMCPGEVHFHQVTLLRRRQLRLFAAQMTLRLGHLHSFSCSGADQVGFELCHHRQDVEKQPSDRVGGVVNGSTDAEFDAFDGEFIDDVFRIPKRTGKPVEFGNHEGVAVPARGEGFSKTGSCSVGAGESVVGVDQVRSNAEVLQGVSLGGEVLFVRGYARVSDQKFIHTQKRCSFADREVKNNPVSGPFQGTRPRLRIPTIGLSSRIEFRVR